MTTVLGFKRHLQPAVVAGEGAYLFSEQGVTALRGSHVELLTGLLDGTRTRHEVLSAAPDAAAPEALAELVARLSAANLVAEYPTEVADHQAAAYWEAAGLEGAAAVDRAAATSVRLLTLGSVDAARAVPACRGAGVEVSAGAELTVVLCDDYLDPRLAAVDAEHRAAGRAWLLAKPVGTTLWVGPVFEPGRGACWTCLSYRLWGNRWAEAQVQRALNETRPAPRPAVSIAASLDMGFGLAMLAAVQWAAGLREPGQRDVRTFDTLRMRSHRHRLQRRPECETCGDRRLVRQRSWQPVLLGSRQKVSCEGGGHRSSTGQEVYDRYRHLISPITGLVAELRPHPRAPDFTHVYVADENPMLRPTRPGAMRPSLRRRNGGKGVTELDARVSALCEALERRSGTFHGDEARLRAGYEQVKELAVHPNACQLYDERQYAGRAEWNATHAPTQDVCEPLDETVPIDWTPLWSLTHDRRVLLPTSMLYYGTPPESGHGFARADSNGAAAGSSLEDAVLQGLLELVERDAVAVWWYNRTRQPAVDIDAFADRWIARQHEGHAGLGRVIWALDLTTDLGIPVVAAFSRRVGERPEEIVFGFGAHFDPHLALRRALTEVNQLLPLVLGDEYGLTDPEATRWWREATVEEHPYLLPDPSRPAAAHTWTPTGDLLDDVRAGVAAIARQGMEVLVLDQTRPDIELPVARVVVPGLRHFWARFGPGRLFDVPVRMGRLAAVTPYEELNPVPLFV